MEITSPSTQAPQILVDLVESADIRFNGDRPWDIIVHNPATYRYTLAKGTLGFGEAYMEGYWDCDQLDLQPDDHMLDIGCGWGSLARYAVEEYGARVTGITISKEQQKLAQENCNHLDVEILFCDYRSLTGKFNKIASIGMFEHVGKLNYKGYFDVIHNLLTNDGLMLLHTIGDYSTHDTTDPWINEYIFPNGQLPSASRIALSIEPNLVIRDWHDFGPDYDKTIMAWWHNFDRNWPELRQKYGQRFYRMWRYYLHSCAGLFRSGQGQLWQITLTKRGALPDYQSYRPHSSGQKQM
jgi:cyclopropane-fatty-acyl-phospholipid synthase